MSVLDTSLIKPRWGGSGPQGPWHGTGHGGSAVIDGWAFDIDPTSVQLPIKAKVQKFRTVGGFVVQVYGTTWGDLTVTGQFGTGGWRAQLAFLDRMVNIAAKQSIQRKSNNPTQNFIPSQPFRFSFPLFSWDFQCYLKAYSSTDGPMAVHQENITFNPKWTLTLFIVTDNGSLTPVAKNAYLQRLAPGLGVMWDTGKEQYTGYAEDEYDAPLTSADVQNYVNSPTGVGSAADVIPIMASGLSGPSTAANPSGSTSAVGTTGKSVIPGNVNSISGANDFSVALLSYLGIVSTASNTVWAVGSSQATNDVLMINAQQMQEGQWGASGDFNAANMKNPLNINSPSGYGYGYSYGIDGVGGTGSFPSWTDGVTGTGELYKQYPGVMKGLEDSNVDEFCQGLVDGGWAGSTYGASVKANYIALGGTQT
jgi:hypothetical protein